MPQNMSFWSNGVYLVHSFQKIWKQFRLANLCVNGTSSPVLPRLSCSNETVGNAQKHEFWVQWSGSGAFDLKIFEATSFGEVVQ
jgi:hypothetical protein